MTTIFSIIIPVYNEDESIGELVDEIINKIPIKDYKYEIVIIDDCSTDNTKKILEELYDYSFIKYFSNSRNMGQSFSIKKGIELSNSNIIVTLDGDGQNNPSDIMRLYNLYCNEKDIKLLGGIRIKRKDTIIKIISSKVANYIRQLILKDECIDTGCSLKIFDRKIFLQFPFFTGLHRFLPALFKAYGYKTKFENVDHRKRNKGVSKYGVYNRFFRGIRDIFRVLKIINKIKNDKLFK